MFFADALFLAGENALHLTVELEIHDLPFTGHACRHCSSWQLLFTSVVQLATIFQNNLHSIENFVLFKSLILLLLFSVLVS